MMGAPTPAVEPVPSQGLFRRPLPRRRRRAVLARLLTLPALALALLGCGPGAPLPSVIYMGLAVGGDEAINPELLKELQTSIRRLETSYRQIYPGTQLQFSLYPEDRIVEAIRQRNAAGLAPDVMLVNGDIARQLFQNDLIDPFPVSADEINAFGPSDLGRFRLRDGLLLGLPLLVQTQLACFDRRRLGQPPASTQQLLAVSAIGRPIGLPANVHNLFWSAGSLGAEPGITRVLSGGTPSPEERAGIERWLSWLQDASTQQRVLFYANQDSAEADLIDGRLDWIPCRSTAIPRLSAAMGPRLGVATLPDGDGFSASPVNRIRVLTLGRNSSRAGRQRALRLSRFTLSPVIQRTITVGTKTFLPANRHVRVPVLSSTLLAAMVAASEQGRRSEQVMATIHNGDRRLPALQSLINELVFGQVSPDAATDKIIAILRRPR